MYKTDSATISQFKETPNGYLNVSAIVTRNGIFKYDYGKEYRPYDEISKESTMESMKNIPVTSPHPPDLLNIETTSMYQKGFVSGVPKIEQIGNDLYTVRLDDIIVTDPSLINEIKEKYITEISLGYDADSIKKKGKFDSVDYEYEQRDIVYNHLAFVKSGRCGSICRVVFDSEEVMCTCQQQKNKQKGYRMDEGTKEKEEPKKEEKMDYSEEFETLKKGHEELKSQHGEIISMLKKLLGDEKTDSVSESEPPEKKEEEPKKDSEKGLEEGKGYKDKKMDSIDSAMYNFNSSAPKTSETRFDYNNQSYANKIINGGKK